MALLEELINSSFIFGRKFYKHKTELHKFELNILIIDFKTLNLEIS